jgi:hypothetical protein
MSTSGPIDRARPRPPASEPAAAPRPGTKPTPSKTAKTPLATLPETPKPGVFSRLFGLVPPANLASLGAGGGLALPAAARKSKLLPQPPVDSKQSRARDLQQPKALSTALSALKERSYDELRQVPEGFDQGLSTASREQAIGQLSVPEWRAVGDAFAASGGKPLKIDAASAPYYAELIDLVMGPERGGSKDLGASLKQQAAALPPATTKAEQSRQDSVKTFLANLGEVVRDPQNAKLLQAAAVPKTPAEPR